MPDDYEHNYCAEDGQEWPCSTVRPTDAEMLAALEAYDDFNVKTWASKPITPRKSLDQHQPLAPLTGCAQP